MSRSYKGIRAKKNRVYSVVDLQKTYRVSGNTISNWVKAGLLPSDSKKPYVFRGARVAAFRKEQRERSTVKLRAGEFKCTGCKLAVLAEVDTLEERVLSNGVSMSFGRCSECEAHVRKIISQADRDFFARQRNPNTTMESLHEENSKDPGGIWKRSEKDDQIWWPANDRVIYTWQTTYAGRYDEKTIDRHLAAIRFCEDVTAGKPFSQFTTRDVSKVRDTLKQSIVAEGDKRKSRSTVKHIASHLTAFLEWLIKQDGFKTLPRDLPDYLKLPKAVFAASLHFKAKEYPTLEEAEALLLAMPSRSLMDQRARAIFAIAFLGALRADTIISLRICHFDPKGKQIIQDASVVRTKNGKSMNINWFPVPKSFSDAVNDWITRLKSAGFTEQDALFPSDASLKNRRHLGDPDRDPILPMSTIHAVTEAFAIACRHSSVKYTPHSAKHTIAADRDARPLTHEQRKAWSENMGHESEQITQAHYGKLSDDRRKELFEDIKEEKPTDMRDITDQEKVEFFDQFVALMPRR